MKDGSDVRSGSRIVLGALLIAIGAILLLERFDVLMIGSPWRLWPIALIATGLGKLAEARNLGPAHAGLWLLIVGAWFLVRNLGLLGRAFDLTWPLLLVGFGAALVWESLLHRGPMEEPEEAGHER